MTEVVYGIDEELARLQLDCDSGILEYCESLADVSKKLVYIIRETITSSKYTRHFFHLQRARSMSMALWKVAGA